MRATAVTVAATVLAAVTSLALALTHFRAYAVLVGGERGRSTSATKLSCNSRDAQYLKNARRLVSSQK